MIPIIDFFNGGVDMSSALFNALEIIEKQLKEKEGIQIAISTYNRVYENVKIPISMQVSITIKFNINYIEKQFKNAWKLL